LLKVVEVVVLLCAGALFFGWQWRDLRQAREHTRKQRDAAQIAKSEQDIQDASSPKGPHGT
jgi:predicted negative regulator of RcsB-dependent stress response